MTTVGCKGMGGNAAVTNGRGKNPVGGIPSPDYEIGWLGMAAADISFLQVGAGTKKS